jgi:hypothetical protein
MAKNIHQQRVGTVAGIQFSPFTVMASQALARRRVSFQQPSLPAWISKNAFVRSGMEIAVPALIIGTKNHCRRWSSRLLMEKRMFLGPMQVPRTQVSP